jgi:hypothetical protein
MFVMKKKSREFRLLFGGIGVVNSTLSRRAVSKKQENRFLID